MGRITPADLAEHIAAILDGDYDDWLEVYVSASAVGNGFDIRLSECEEERKGAYRVTIEQVE